MLWLSGPGGLAGALLCISFCGCGAELSSCEVPPQFSQRFHDGWLAPPLRPGAQQPAPLPPWGWWRAHTGWAEPQDDPGPGQRALADQGGGGAARSCVTIKMLTKYAFGACGSTACSRPPSLKLRHSSAGHRGAASGRALWRA
eukprot:COSAG01_NODE_1502_length_10101_cov_6.907119_8_plen_143_part_00